MAFSYAGKCYPDIHQAADAFLQQFPRLETGAGAPMVYEITYSNVSTIGVYYLMQSRNITTGQVVALPGDSVIFPACTAEDLSGYAIQDVVLVLALIVVWALGFQSGMHR